MDEIAKEYDVVVLGTGEWELRGVASQEHVWLRAIVADSCALAGKMLAFTDSPFRLDGMYSLWVNDFEF